MSQLVHEKQNRTNKNNCFFLLLYTFTYSDSRYFSRCHITIEILFGVTNVFDITKVTMLSCTHIAISTPILHNRHSYITLQFMYGTLTRILTYQFRSFYMQNSNTFAYGYLNAFNVCQLYEVRQKNKQRKHFYSFILFNFRWIMLLYL